MIKIDDPIRCSCLFRLPNDISDQGGGGCEQIKEAICAKSCFLIRAGQTKQPGLTYGSLLLCAGNISGRRRWRVVQKQAGEKLITEVPDGGEKNVSVLHLVQQKNPLLLLVCRDYVMKSLTSHLPLWGSLHGAREPYLAK